RIAPIELSPGQYAVIALLMHIAFFCTVPGTPQLRDLVRSLFVMIENDRPLTTGERFVHLDAGVPLFLYFTTCLACNDRKAAGSFLWVALPVILIVAYYKIILVMIYATLRAVMRLLYASVSQFCELCRAVRTRYFGNSSSLRT